jgi:hypothetical protein
MKWTVLLLFLTGCATGTKLISPPIEGGFGYKLGTISTAITPSQEGLLYPLFREDSVGPWFEVEASGTFGPLKRCFISITPTSRKIYRIVALGQCTGCPVELKVTSDAVREKYGAIKLNETSLFDGVRFTSGHRTVEVHSNDRLGEGWLWVTYQDDVILAEKKREVAEWLRNQHDMKIHDLKSSTDGQKPVL